MNESRIDMHESHNHAYTHSLLIEIQALIWVQVRIQDLVINNKVRKEKKRKEKREQRNTVKMNAYG
jgi:hypothetical protein